MGCWRSHPHLRSRHSERAGCSVHRASSADWNGRSVLTVEFSDEPALSQSCRGHRRRLLDHPQGGRRNSCWCVTHRSGVARRRTATWSAEFGVWYAVGNLRPSHQAGTGAPGRFYWLHRSRSAPDNTGVTIYDARPDGTGRTCTGYCLRGHGRGVRCIDWRDP